MDKHVEPRRGLALLCAAIQYGMSTTSPRTAEPMARPSHHDDFLNSPHVATVKPSNVAKAKIWVIAHKMP
jgi:hypothetical protein